MARGYDRSAPRHNRFRLDRHYRPPPPASIDLPYQFTSKVTARHRSGFPYANNLLLVAPAAWFLLAAVAVSRGALRQRTALATTVLVLTGLLTISAVNPLQGGLTVGLGGLLLVVPSMLAFWVGRSLVDDRTLRRVVALVAWLALPAAAYGLIQTFAGFPSWDARWITENGYTALNVGGLSSRGQPRIGKV